MTYLIEVTEVYRANSEEEATKLIEDAKVSNKFTLVKSSTTYKEKKSKGEVIDFYWKVSLTKKFNDEKEPETGISIEYERGSAF